MSMLPHLALVPAAGSGSRMQSGRPKQYLLMGGKPLLWHTLFALHQSPLITHVMVVISAQDTWFDHFSWDDLPRLTVLRAGGASRAESVRNGLSHLAQTWPAATWVLVHDAARPCLSSDLIHTLITTLGDDDIGGILAVPVPETVKSAQTTSPPTIAKTIPRDTLWLAQTPQMFRLGPLLSAHAGDLTHITDEASAMERMGASPKLIASRRENLKVTYPEDLEFATWWLQTHPLSTTLER